MANLQTVKQKAAEADAQHGTGGLMTKKVDAAVKGMMANKVNPNQSWQVIAVVDRSGSMGNEYANGAVQNALDIVLGFSIIVDDDGEVPTVFFNSGITTHTIGLKNFHGFLAKNNINAGGSTNLMDALHEVARLTGNDDIFRGGGLFKRGGSKPSVKKMQTPAFVIVITDGVPDDRAGATNAIAALSYRGLFFKFIYVGHDDRGLQYLKSLDDDIPVGVPYERGGRLIDNVDMKEFSSLRGASDADVYTAMFDEVSGWLAEAAKSQLV